MSNSLSKAQAASAAGLSERSIDRAIAAGELPATREHGRIQVERENLERWAAARQAGNRRHDRVAELDQATKSIAALISQEQASV